MINASAKFIVLDKIIDELVVKQRKKVLIFSGFTRMLDCCEDFLHLRMEEKFKYVRLDGGTSRGMSIFVRNPSCPAPLHRLRDMFREQKALNLSSSCIIARKFAINQD